MATSRALEQLTLAELKTKLSAIRKIHAAISAVLGLILLAWVVTGYWDENLAAFISAIAMAVTISAALIASRSGLVKEVQQRESDLRKTHAKPEANP